MTNRHIDVWSVDINIESNRLASEDLEQMGESTDGLAVSAAKLQEKIKSITGVNILIDDSTFKSTYDILLEISKVWNDLSDVSRANVLETLAGKTRSSTVAGLLQNMSVAEEAVKSAAASAGSALKENEVYLDSISGKMKLFQAQSQEMWSNFLSSDFLESIVELGTKLLALVDDFGVVKSAFAAFSAVVLLKKFSSIKSGITGIVEAQLKLGQVTKVLEADNLMEAFGDVKDLKKIAEATKGLNASILAQQLSQKGLNAEQIRHILISQGVQAEQIETAITSTGVTKANFLQATSWKALWVASKKFFASPVGKIAIIATALVAVGAAIAWVHKSQKELDEELDKSKEKYEEISTELKSVNDELKTTQERIDELLSKDKLTFVEQGELAELQKITAEMRLQQDILNRQQDNVAKEVNEKNLKAYEKLIGGGNVEDIYSGIQYLDGSQKTVKQALAYNKAYREALEKGQWSGVGVHSEKEIQEALDNNIVTIEKHIEKINTYRQPLIELELKGTITEDEKKKLQEMTETLRTLYLESDNAADWNKIKFDSIFDNEGLEITKEKLVEMATAGELSEETLNAYPKLKEAIEAVDFILGEATSKAQLFTQEINAVADTTAPLRNRVKKQVVAATKYGRLVSEHSPEAYNETAEKERIEAWIDTLEEEELHLVATIEFDADTTAESAQKALDAARPTLENANEKFNKIINSKALLGSRDELYKLAEEGNLTKEAAESNEMFQQLLLGTDFTSDVLIEKINKLGTAFRNSFDEAKSGANGLISGFSLLSQALGEQEKNGKLAAGTVMSIIDAGYANVLVEENGQLKVSAELYKIVAKRKIDLQIADLEILKTDLTAKINRENVALQSMTLTTIEANKAALEYHKTQAMMSDDGVDLAAIDAQINALNALGGRIDKGDWEDETGKDKDPWKDAFDKAYAALQHKLNMDKINQKQFYSELDALNNYYFAGNSKYIEEYRKNIEELYSTMKSINEDTINDLEHNLDMSIKRGASNQEQLKAYEELQSEIASQAKFWRSKGLDDNHELIQGLQKQWWTYADNIRNINKDIISDMEHALNMNANNGLSEQGQIQAYERLRAEVHKQANLLRAQGLDDNHEYIQSLQNQWWGYTEKIKSLNESLIESAKESIEKANKELNRSLGNLNELRDDYDGAINAVTNALDEQIESIQESREVQEKYYDDLIKSKREELDALQETNDERQKQLDLEKAMYDLERAKNQKTNRVYREGQGFVYESDTDSIRKAQDTLDKLAFDKIISTKEKEINALEESKEAALTSYDEQIERLDTIKKSWEEIGEAYEKLANINLANNLFGVDWKSQILNGDTKHLNVMEALYGDVETQIANIEDQLKRNERVIESVEDYAEAWKNGEVTFSEAYDKIQAKATNAVAETEATQSRINKTDEYAQKWIESKDLVQEALTTIDDALVLAKDSEYDVLEERMNNMRAFAAEFKSLASECASALSSIQQNLQSAKQSQAELMAIKGATNVTVKTNGSTAVTSVGKSHSGMELGYVGEKQSEGKDAFKMIALEPLKPDEIPKILQIGEGVVTKMQQQNILSNVGSAFKAGASLFNVTPKDVSTVSLSTGDIHVHEVQKADEFAKAVASQFLPTLNQQLFKN